MANTMAKAKPLDIKYDKKDENESVPLIAYDVSFSGADFPVDGVVQRMNNKDFRVLLLGEEFQNDDIKGFQRSFVWNRSHSDKFIESLLMGLPVPGIFLAKTSDNIFLVIDGQQRLMTLQQFYDTKRKKPMQLGVSVQEKYRGITYESLSEKDRRRLDNSIIRATIIRQESPDGYDSIYHVFERLNSTGKMLTPQQIRMVLHHGEFADLLVKLNKNSTWRTLLGQKSIDSFLRDIEMILRFFALFYDSGKYKNPMKNFLNKFMEKRKNIPAYEQQQYEQLFCDTIVFIEKNIGERAFCGRGKKPSAAIVDSLMYGVAKRITSVTSDMSRQEIEDVVNKMLDNPKYQEAVSKRTSNPDNVKQRLDMSEQYLCQK